jgi:hypothetical protein
MRLPGKIWKIWLRVVTALGTVQMLVMLSLVYWLFMPFMFVATALFRDPLMGSRRRTSTWLTRPAVHHDHAWFKEQG